MLFMLAVVLLAGWILGLVGVYDIGRAVHVPLLVGLLLLMVGGLRARDGARPNGGPGTRVQQ